MSTLQIEKRKVGRPKKIVNDTDHHNGPKRHFSAVQLKRNIQRWYEANGMGPKGLLPPTQPLYLSRLAIDIGFHSRKVMISYEHDPVFSVMLKQAIARVEAYYEKLGQTSRGTFAQFALKNLGWSDQSQVDVTSKGAAVKGFEIVYAAANKSQESTTTKAEPNGNPN
jgi:hypothetical protein